MFAEGIPPSERTGFARGLAFDGAVAAGAVPRPSQLTQSARDFFWPTFGSTADRLSISPRSMYRSRFTSNLPGPISTNRSAPRCRVPATARKNSTGEVI